MVLPRTKGFLVLEVYRRTRREIFRCFQWYLLGTRTALTHSTIPASSADMVPETEGVARDSPVQPNSFPRPVGCLRWLASELVSELRITSSSRCFFEIEKKQITVLSYRVTQVEWDCSGSRGADSAYTTVHVLRLVYAWELVRTRTT